MNPSETAVSNRSANSFGSSLSTVLTLAGVAIGLGNVWRFPYMMGSYGGSAFLLLYLVLMLVIAVPALMAELSLARHFQGATIKVMRLSFGGFGRFLGYLLVAGVGIAASYYMFVVANVFYSAGFSLFIGFSDSAISGYTTGLGNPKLQYLIGLSMLWSCILVISVGLKSGVERISKVFVPFFFLVCIYLVYFTLSQPGAIDASLEFLQPDFSRIGFTEVYAALGQCVFSAGLGAAYIMVYGRFLRADESIGKIARYTALSDLSASLLASLFIVPSVLLFALPLDSGPHLLFDTLPRLFALMGGARISASLFLVALSLIAYLSVIASFNVLILSLEEEPLGQRWGRNKLLLVIGVVESLMLIAPTWNPEIIGPLDLLFGSGSPVVGCLFAVLAIAWRVGRRDALQQMFLTAEPGSASRLLFAWVQWGIPAALIIILLGTIYSALL
ncbi:MAG: sodium-dependent transporter [Xanthomonadales bacterium]|nr:sodium-dependent transporter [Xanthomonadales bacterium]